MIDQEFMARSLKVACQRNVREMLGHQVRVHAGLR